jgi:hypothetical protein
MAKMLSLTERRLVCDGPTTVEVVIREKESEQILHLVNIAPGQRQRDPEVQPFLNLEI